MVTPPLAIVIATYRRADLFRRTLDTLAACRLPASLQRVIVVENGPEQEAAHVIDAFRHRLPLEYHHIPLPSKSAALNLALAQCRDEFVVFFDDDVRVHPETVMVYADAVAGRRRGLFIGGRCYVDYEKEPPGWLKTYLPLSAKGWSKGDTPCVLTTPEALGFNWGAFAEDLAEAGGFDVKRGPGLQLPIGEETKLQETLLQNGVTGLYLPNAAVWHFVPAERCTPEWALRRWRQMGMYAGLKVTPRSRMERLQHLFSCNLRLVYFEVLLKAASRMLSVERKFHFEQRRHWCRGKHDGLQLATH